MVRYVTPAEYQRLVRDELRRQQDAINRYNREVDAHNREVQRRRQQAIDEINRHNRAVDAHNRTVVQRQQQAIDTYNREVRAHNSRVLAHQQRQRTALAQLRGQTITVQYSTLHTSALTLNTAYERLAQHVGAQFSDENDDLILGFPGRENANSLEVVNALLGEGPAPQTDMPIRLQETAIGAELRQISGDLDSRWRGALFALDPRNPDAARHFCTSAREVITHILEVRAPDDDVVRVIPDCSRTSSGKPTRRAKIQFLLQRRGISSGELENFVDADITNVVDLFQVFNSATHGEAGKYDFNRLSAIKTRVEGGIIFLSRLATTPA